MRARRECVCARARRFICFLAHMGLCRTRLFCGFNEEISVKQKSGVRPYLIIIVLLILKPNMLYLKHSLGLSNCPAHDITSKRMNPNLQILLPTASVLRWHPQSPGFKVRSVQAEGVQGIGRREVPAVSSGLVLSGWDQRHTLSYRRVFPGWRRYLRLVQR